VPAFRGSPSWAILQDLVKAGELAAFEQACLEGLDPAVVQGAPDVRALLTAGLQAVVEAVTTARPRSALTGRALRRFDVEAPAEDGAGEPEGSFTERYRAWTRSRGARGGFATG
jgi:hypothetical protein